MLQLMLHPGIKRSYVVITSVSIRLDCFSKARMRKSSIIIEACLGVNRELEREKEREREGESLKSR